MDSTAQLLLFYGWWQLAVCTFACVALLAIWWHIGRKQKDDGQVWLSLSLLCWAVSGLVEVIYANQIITDGPLPSAAQFNRDGWRSICSLFNSLFILLSLPWFRYLPKQLSAIIQSQYWNYVIGLPFLFSLMPTISRMLSGRTISLISELDVYYALLTLGFLGYVLWESFKNRRLLILAILSVISILITLAAQVFKIAGSDSSQILLAAIFKTTLIMLFFALALSWVKELSEKTSLDISKLFLKLYKSKNEGGRYSHLVNINGYPNQEDLTIRLTQGNHELLSKFAMQSKSGQNPWLEIKPKNDVRSGKTYPIKDHNEVKRLITNLLDGIYGKDVWDNSQHYVPLKESLFEMSKSRKRKIKINIPSENIEIDA